MNRKYNPYVSLVALLLLALILVLTCTGCTLEISESGKRWISDEAEETEPAPRFTSEFAGNGCTIITDSETGMQYLFYYYPDMDDRAGGGLCKLEG